LNAIHTVDRTTSEDGRYLLKVEFKDTKKKPKAFAFKGKQGEKERDKIYELIKEQPAMEEFLSAIDVQKIHTLHENPHLRELFDELVATNKMSEADFWKYAKEVQLTDMSQQKSGIRNKPFTIPAI